MASKGARDLKLQAGTHNPIRARGEEGLRACLPEKDRDKGKRGRGTGQRETPRNREARRQRERHRASRRLAESRASPDGRGGCPFSRRPASRGGKGRTRFMFILVKGCVRALLLGLGRGGPRRLAGAGGRGPGMMLLGWNPAPHQLCHLRLPSSLSKPQFPPLHNEVTTA